MSENLNEPQSRTEEILQNALGEEYDVTPQSRVEKLLTQIFEGGAGKGGFEVHICTSGEYDTTTKVPTIATPDPKTLYLVPSSNTAGNLFDEYIYVDNKWEKFGGVQIEGWAKNIMDGSGQNAVKQVGASDASKKGAFAEGTATKASGINSHAEGNTTIASGNNSHAEGNTTIAYAHSSHAEGVECVAGVKSNANSGTGAHAEGIGSVASGNYSHAEGNSKAQGHYSHAESAGTATGQGSHAEGNSTKASGSYSHAEGQATTAASTYQHVFGKYNVEDANNVYVEIVGNGNSDTKANARTLDWSGNEWLAGSLTLGNTTLTEANLIELLALLNA